MRGKETEQSTVPPEFMARPFEALQRSLFTLFRSAASSQVFSQSLQEGVVGILLAELSTLTATEHRQLDQFEKFQSMTFSPERDKKNKMVAASSGKFWAKGTGYGTNFDDDEDNSWNHLDYVKQQDQKAEQVNRLLRGFCDLISVKPDWLPEGFFEVLEPSCLIPVLESYLKNDSLLDMGRHMFLYQSVLDLVKGFVAHDSLIPLVDTLPRQSSSLWDMLSNLNSMAETILRRLSKATIPKDKKEKTKDKEVESGEKDDDSEGDSSVEDQTVLANAIIDTYSAVRERLEKYRDTKHPNGMTEEEPTEERQSIDKQYRQEMKPLQFSETLLVDAKKVTHHYKQRFTGETVGPAKIKRLIQEVGTLSSNLPLHLGSSVFLRVDEERIDVMQAMIVGPESTPYDNGCFIFDIYCPHDYPKGPPLVNMQTTGGGTVRFNPNLYNCGKVCLSLLGTWEGGTNEKWNEKTSTLLQVMVSIQSLIFVEQPYFNEPGYEADMNTPHGKQQSSEYNETIRLGTIRWAMIEQLRSPSLGFEEAIRLHFKLKTPIIAAQMKEWLKEAQASKSSGYHQKLKKHVQDLRQELEKLDPVATQEAFSDLFSDV